jgi:hypothetical protein
MKNKLLFILVLSSLGTIAYADPDPSSGVNPPGHASHHMPRIKVSAPDNNKSPVEIVGMCTIKQSASNPLAGPCVNLVVVLNHADGTEYLKNRTTSQGKFSFEAENGQQYQLALGSKLYEIVSPKGLIAAGQKIDLRLEQK